MLTPAAKRALQPALDARIAEEKSTYRERLQRLQRAYAPPLSNAELSLALGLSAPPHGTFGASSVGRFVSTSPRLRRARPDREVRVLIDQILGGHLYLGVREGPYGARREATVFAEQDLRWLDSAWTVIDHSNGERIRTWSSADLEDPDVWDMFGAPTAGAPASDVVGRPVAGRSVHPIALGCMRLSTEPHEDPHALIHAALDAGVRLLDTADSYCTDESDLHANERLIAEALERWEGPSHEVVVVTKAGLSRPGGRWVPDASPDRLRRSCEGSLHALGRSRLGLFQLHVIDRAVPFTDSLDALSALKDEGLIERIGLCNLTVEQLEIAAERIEVSAVQVALHPFTRTGWPLLAACLERGIPLLAHSPLGGHRQRNKVAADPVLGAIASRHRVTPHQIALALSLELAPNLVPLVGATRVQSITDSVRAATVSLTPEDHGALAKRFTWLQEATEALRAALPAEVVMLTGSPASGKTTATAPYLARGYLRLNRDERGGRLADLLPPLEQALADGVRQVVLDNTYATRVSREGVIQVATRHGIDVRAEHVDITESDALVNAAQRILERQGRLLGPEELKKAAASDPNMLPPVAIHRFFATCQPPHVDEGLARVDIRPFVRRRQGQAKAILFDYDGTLRTSSGPAPFPMHPDEVVVPPGRIEALAAMRADGFLLLGVSNQAGIARGALTAEMAATTFQHTNTLLGQDIDVRWCPHDSGEIRCWCRKPMPGMGVALIRDHDLDPAACLVVGDMDSDAQFAAHLGMGFVHADDFFAAPG